MTPMQRDTALAMFVAAGTGALVGGPSMAGQAFACAALAGVNLLVYRSLVERTTADIASGGNGGLAGTLLAGKLIATLAIVAGMLSFVEPIALVIGLATVLGATALSGTVHSLRAEATA